MHSELYNYGQEEQQLPDSGLLNNLFKMLASRLGMVGHTCNPTTQEAEAGGRKV
jgi:hypothetical protein